MLNKISDLKMNKDELVTTFKGLLIGIEKALDRDYYEMVVLDYLDTLTNEQREAVKELIKEMFEFHLDENILNEMCTEMHAADLFEKMLMEDAAESTESAEEEQAE